MNKLKKLCNKVNVAKVVPVAMLCAYSFNAVYCSTLLNGFKSLSNKLTEVLLGIISGVALVMLLWNGIMMVLSAHDQKAKDARKQAMLTIFKVYGIVLLSGFILNSIYTLATEAFGSGANILTPTSIDSSGALK